MPDGGINKMENKQHVSYVKLIIAGCIFLILGAGSATADPPVNWYRSDEGLSLSSGSTSAPNLFTFDNRVYASDSGGLYVQLYNTPCFGWDQVTNVPTGAGSFRQVGDYLYASGSGSSLWWVGKGSYPTIPTWHAVTSTGIFYGAVIHPEAMFGGQLYAAVFPGTGTFDIYRTPDVGKSSMAWTKVVSNGFGDSNNHELGSLIEYNSKLLAVTTNTRTDPSASFGDDRYYGTGIEVWESATGDLGTWNQVNQDGFGTEVLVHQSDGSDVMRRTNQDMGSAAVYNGYLYIGTLAHWNRGEVWRYNGTVLVGWTDVTPDGLCAGSYGCGGPSRAAAMAVYNNLLYLGEGVSTGNLETYDGTTWTIVVPGEWDGVMGHPFAPENRGIYSLAVLLSKPTLPGNAWTGDKLFALTTTNTGGAQIWSYPFGTAPPTCSALRSATISISPKTATTELFPGATHSYTVTINAGPGFDFSQVLIGLEERVSQYYGGGGGQSGAVGWVPPGGTWESTYPAWYEGPTALMTDNIEVGFHNSQNWVEDTATNTWIDTIPEIGVFRQGKWYVDADANRVWIGTGIQDDAIYSFGLSGDYAVVGDWNRNGKTEIGVFRAGKWYVDFNANNAWNGASVDRVYTFGLAGDKAVTGDWNRDGKPEIGVFRAGKWYVDLNANNAWDGVGTGKDAIYSFGKVGDTPVMGLWS